MWFMRLYELMRKLRWILLPWRLLRWGWDRLTLGPRIKRRAKEYEDPEEYKTYAWALHKESNLWSYFYPKDFTPKELNALTVMGKLDVRRGPKSILLDKICRRKRGRKDREDEHKATR